MLTERQKLQIELERTLDLLDKQKTRRMVIMSLIHSVVPYIVLAAIDGSFPDELLGILISVAISLVFGFVSFVFHVSCFSMVTDSFTEIQALENRAKILSDRIKKNSREIKVILYCLIGGIVTSIVKTILFAKLSTVKYNDGVAIYISKFRT